MTDRKKVRDPKVTAFPFVRTKAMVASSGLSPDTLKQLRRDNVLKEKIHWFHPPGSVRVLWNIRLVLDFLVNGDSPAHRRAIETYAKSLPSSDAA